MHRSTLIALAGCGMLMTSCAAYLPVSTAAPRVEMPPEARRPCSLYRLPANPTQADLEFGYTARGANVAACDAARGLAVKTHDDEHALEAKAQPRPWWRVWP